MTPPLLPDTPKSSQSSTAPGASHAPGAAEFDRYAADYDAEISHPLKTIFGKGNAAYMDAKAQWLLRDLARRPLASGRSPENLALLDYGCGTGLLLTAVLDAGFEGSACGCDVSQEMLVQARHRWSGDRAPEFRGLPDGRADFNDGTFDVIMLSAVLHHVQPAQRHLIFDDCRRLIRPGGRLVVFEHNPFNPLTQWLVRTLPMDADAQLLRASEVRTVMLAASFEEHRTSYYLFFPPRIKWLRRLERVLGWVPLGAQYAVAGDRPLDERPAPGENP